MGCNRERDRKQTANTLQQDERNIPRTLQGVLGDPGVWLVSPECVKPRRAADRGITAISS